MNRSAHRTIACTYTALLLAFTLYAALDTFVIPHRITAVAYESQAAGTAVSEITTAGSSAPRVTKTVHGQTTSEDPASVSTEADQSTQAEESAGEQTADTQTQAVPLDVDGTVIGTYEDGGAQITITQVEAYDTDVYIADIILSSPDALQTALASDTYGRNIKEETSAIANAHDAVLAINGDFYGSRTEGYVIRNGVLYRDSAGADREGLAIMEDGSFLFYEEADISAQALLSQGAVQAFSFGPALLRDGEITVSETEEVGKAMASNPRTAVGMVDDLHYVFVVSDGRTNASEGLSLYELAQVMRDAGVTDAYNLDGGGSSTMVFQGSVINNPTTGGRNIREREVSDILYIGGTTT